MMKEQNEVYEAVVARGYREGWRVDLFLARQVVKLVEEVAEAGALVAWLPNYFRAEIRNAGASARWLFDSEEKWVDQDVPEPEALAKELADLQVVLFCAAAALGELTGEPFDVVQAAREKATADVARGVRGDDGTRTSADERGGGAG